MLQTTEGQGVDLRFFSQRKWLNLQKPDVGLVCNFGSSRNASVLRSSKFGELV